MKKKLSVLLVTVLVLSMLAGCGKKEKAPEVSNNTPPQQEQKIDNETNKEVEKVETEDNEINTSLKLSKTEQLAATLVTAISNEDYNKVAELLGVGLNEFLTAEDMKSYFMKKGNDDLLGAEIEIKDVRMSESGDTRQFEVVYSDGRKEYTYSGSIVLKGTDWIVTIPELFIEDWVVVLPRDAKTVTINNADISPYIKGERGEFLDEYIIPVVSLSVKEVFVDTDFGSYTKEVLPIAGVDAEKIYGEVDRELALEVAETYRNILNNIITAAHKKSGEASIVEYFDGSVTTEFIKAMYDGAVKAHAEYPQSAVTKVTLGLSEFDVVTRIYSNDAVQIVVYLDYSLGGSKSMGLQDYAVLRKMEDGSYKIVSMAREGKALIWANPYTSDKR